MSMQGRATNGQRPLGYVDFEIEESISLISVSATGTFFRWVGLRFHMTKAKRSVPFSVSILTLMALIVVPLAVALLWLGWRAVDKLEQHDGTARLAALDEAVSVFLTNDLHTIVSVGLTLTEVAGFSPQAGSTADDERARHLLAALQQHPALAAAFAGYPDGHFIFVGHMSSFSAEQRAEYGAPEGDPTIVRIIDGEGAARREVWWFQNADGSRSAVREKQNDYDPRTRPWYVESIKLGGPALTEPYRFAQSGEPGISAGIPMRAGGVIGFDFSLDTLSRLLGRYKVTPNSIIMASTSASDVLIELEACAPSADGCLPGDAEVRAALKHAVIENPGIQSVDRPRNRGGRPRLQADRPSHAAHARQGLHHRCDRADSRTRPMTSHALLEHAAEAAAIAVGLAILAALAVSLLLSRSLARITAKTERIRNLDFSDRVPVVSRIREVLRLSIAVEQMREGLEVFGRYVSKDLVRQIMRSPESTGVGGERASLRCCSAT